jgi:hypothetical protein
MAEQPKIENLSGDTGRGSDDALLKSKTRQLMEKYWGPHERTEAEMDELAKESHGTHVSAKKRSKAKRANRNK